jgi:L-serine dehydratase
MTISVFDLFKIGIGPSSSHTVGPMKAAKMFADKLQQQALLPQVGRVKVELFGSLGATGRGHGTDRAVLLGLMGETPEAVSIELAATICETVGQCCNLSLCGTHTIEFEIKRDLRFERRALPRHPNGMTFQAFTQSDDILQSASYYSVGGGFVVDETMQDDQLPSTHDAPPPHPFNNGDELLLRCKEYGLSISDLMLTNEMQWQSETAIRAQLLQIWEVMQACVARGCRQEGILPGGMKVRRRAAELYHKLADRPEEALRDPLTILDWVDLYALAVNEENAAGGRVVTAPTNGAAGIIPAVLHYFMRFHRQSCDDDVVRFLLNAGAIGILFKKNASISGAEVGCQGEVGSACSMAAGALTEVMGGTPEQVENAAEIGMEHNLGLTCDPVGGLVQVPCIERNAMAAIKAINASRMALRGDGTHYVSLDRVIKTMRETGADMKTKYKETARGGLAVNVIEC